MYRKSSPANWFRNCTGGIPVHGVDAPTGAFSGHTTQIAPLRQCAGNASDGDEMSVSSVVHLLLVCGPAAVLWAVFAIAVAALQSVPTPCVSGWTFAHVGEEVGEGGAPAVADLEAATAVVRVADVRFPVAPIQHGPPCPKFGAFGHAVRLSMTDVPALFLKATGHSRHTLSLEAAARFTCFRRREQDCFDRATVALDHDLTRPLGSGASLLHGDFAEDSQAAKAL